MQNCARTLGGWLPAPCHLEAQGAAEAVCCPAATGSSSRGAGPGGTRARRGELTGRALTSTDTDTRNPPSVYTPLSLGLVTQGTEALLTFAEM